MKHLVYGTLVVALAVTLCGKARAEGDRREGDRREGERREGHGDGGGGDVAQRDVVGSFVKSDNGALQLKGGEMTYFVVLADQAKDDVKEKIKNADSVLIGKGMWNVRGFVKKDTSGKSWIAVEFITKREGDGDRRKEGGDGKKEGGDRRKEGHKEGEGDRR